MDGENASMLSSPFECETSALEENHRICKRPVPEEGAVPQAPGKKQKSKQSKTNDVFKRKNEDASDNRSLNSSSSKDKGMNHFTGKKRNHAKPSKPFSPEVHNISQD